MTSIQWHLLKTYFQLHRRISPLSATIDIEKERADMEALAKLFKPLSKFKCSSVDINGVPGEWIDPKSVNNEKVILYLHGGYYQIGSIQSHRNLAGNIAAAAKCRALIIAYRLAPECPFPGGLEDSLTAYKWLLMNDYKAEQIVLAGDSAGGGLVIATMLSIRNLGIALPAGAVCLSPALDLTRNSESWKSNAKKDLVISPYLFDRIKQYYLGEVDQFEVLVSPLFGNLVGLPPTFIQVGSDEVLLSDAKSFTDRGQEAGMDVTLEVWPGMQHVFQFTASFVPEARQAIDRIGKFIQQL